MLVSLGCPCHPEEGSIGEILIGSPKLYRISASALLVSLFV